MAQVPRCGMHQCGCGCSTSERAGCCITIHSHCNTCSRTRPPRGLILHDRHQAEEDLLCNAFKGAPTFPNHINVRQLQTTLNASLGREHRRKDRCRLRCQAGRQRRLQRMPALRVKMLSWQPRTPLPVCCACRHATLSQAAVACSCQPTASVDFPKHVVLAAWTLGCVSDASQYSSASRTIT